MALGALPRQVPALVLRESLSLVAIGIALGLTAASLASYLLPFLPKRSMRYAISGPPSPS